LIGRKSEKEHYRFDEIVKKNRHLVFNLLFRLTGDYHLSEDLFQETFLKVYRNLDEFSEKSKLTTWLYSIALNVYKDHAKKKKWILLRNGAHREQDGALSTNLMSPEDAMIRKEEIAHVQKQINSLKGNIKIPVILYYVEGLPVKEIAEITGRTLSDIKVSLYRARKILRKRWGQGYEDKELS
jgi:RNA polymerase sigma-70 factor (ECF subfamily)